MFWLLFLLLLLLLLLLKALNGLLLLLFGGNPTNPGWASTGTPANEAGSFTDSGLSVLLLISNRHCMSSRGINCTSICLCSMPANSSTSSPCGRASLPFGRSTAGTIVASPSKTVIAKTNDPSSSRSARFMTDTSSACSAVDACGAHGLALPVPGSPSHPRSA